MQPSYRSTRPRETTSDHVALQDLTPAILGYIAADPERLSRFLDLTGLTPQSLRAAAALPGFAGSILDYLASDDRLLLAFAQDQGHDPADLEALRLRLSRPVPGDPG